MFKFIMDLLIFLDFQLDKSLVFEVRDYWTIKKLILPDISLILKIKMDHLLRLRLNNFINFLYAMYLVLYLLIYLNLWVV